LQTALLVGIAYAVFDVQMLGNWGALLGIVGLGALCLISIGYLVASLVRTEESAMPILQLVQFPMMFLSGIFFPVEMLPAFMKPVVSAMPLTYLGDALRQIMVQSTPVNSMNTNIIVMSGILLVCMVLSIRLFKWE
jgi:ABC-2 type transport system permease protein